MVAKDPFEKLDTTTPASKPKKIAKKRKSASASKSSSTTKTKRKRRSTKKSRPRTQVKQ